MVGWNPMGNDKGPTPPDWSSLAQATPPQPPAPAPATPVWPGGYWIYPPPATPAAPTQPPALQPSLPMGYWIYAAQAPTPTPPSTPPSVTAQNPTPTPTPAPTPTSAPTVPAPFFTLEQLYAWSQWPVNTTTPQPNRTQTNNQAPPKTDMPGLNLQNWLGGTGNVPGWNYMFPATHAPIIFIRSGPIRPWTPEFVAHVLNPKNAAVVALRPTTISTKTKVKDLLVSCGATNADPKRNVVVEVVGLGNGMWKRGLCISGADERAELMIGELGWDETRTGEGPEKPFTYLYVTNDTLVSEL